MRTHSFLRPLVHLIVLGVAAAIGVEMPAHAQSAPNQERAREELKRGVEAYKQSDIEQAILHFRRAKEIDPSFVNARLYLATAFAALYIPGAPSDENRQNGESAILEFRGVLEIEPNNLSAIDGMGSVLSNMAGNPFDLDKFVESKIFHKKHIELAPDDADPYYWIGFINWTISYRANDDLRTAHNEKADEPIAPGEPLPTSVRADFAACCDAWITEGIEHLNKATSLKPDYASAFAYLNLLYRLRADLMESEADRQTCLDFADSLVHVYKTIKQKELERAKPQEPDSSPLS
ncbi:MAG: tetratricopeptide repeat protein [Candidatus Acidiferrales bacterium]